MLACNIKDSILESDIVRNSDASEDHLHQCNSIKAVSESALTHLASIRSGNLMSES